MNDTIVIYREPAEKYPDAIKPEYWVAVVLHRKPFEPVHRNRAPDALQDRTVYPGLLDRDAAVSAFESHA